ncbi:hypothetical protein ACO0SA_002035 [Hanseniaspora valbyensis]
MAAANNKKKNGATNGANKKKPIPNNNKKQQNKLKKDNNINSKLQKQIKKTENSNEKEDGDGEDEVLPPPGDIDESDEDELPPPVLANDEEIKNTTTSQTEIENGTNLKKRKLSGGEKDENIPKPAIKKLKPNKKKQKAKKQSSIKAQNINKHKLELPKEHLRRVFHMNKDINSKKFFNKTKQSQLSALKYLPYSILKLLENMPQPWESAKKVKVLYHITGSITFVNETPRVIPPVYLAQWSSVYDEMRLAKRDNYIRRIKFPIFDDDMDIMSFAEDLDGLPLPPPITFENEIDVEDWLYEKNPLRFKNEAKFVNDSYKKWSLDGENLVKLYDLSESLRNEVKDSNYYNLFNMNVHKNAKSLNVSFKDGAKFEPLFGKEDNEDMEHYTEFNSIDRFIIRGHDRSEYKLFFPHLYNVRPRKLVVPQLVNSINCTIDEFDKNKVFGFSEELNPINVQTTITNQTDFEKGLLKNNEKFNISPKIFKNTERDKKTTTTTTLSDAIKLFEAPAPFNKKHGKTERSQDINLLKSWISQHPDKQNYPIKVKKSYQGLLKNKIKTNLRAKKQQKKKHISLYKDLKSKKKIKQRKTSLFSSLRDTKFFQQTTIDWVEAGLQLLKQGHNMLNLLLQKRGISFLHLDYNFNLKPIKTLSTKERKKSRFGHALHLIREFLKMVKLIVDAHVSFRLGKIDSYQLGDAIHYIFNHLGHLTGVYRYKYKVMHQIKQCNDLKHIIYHRFNENVGKGPGCGFWQPSWRVWINFVKGTAPMLETWLKNLIDRQFEGRNNDKVKTVTKQRLDAYYDIELKTSIMNDIMDMIPVGLQQKTMKNILQHLTEAWRCWKANVKWDVQGMPEPVKNLINKYVQKKADNWILSAKETRLKIQQGKKVEKTEIRKNTGRMARIWLIEEKNRQENLLTNGSRDTSPDEAVSIFKNLVEWLESRNYEPIPFPPINYKHDNKIFALALENLKENYSSKSRLTSAEREELALIEKAFENPHESLNRIKKLMITQRIFKPIQFEMSDTLHELYPRFFVDPLEKITDAYLDQYLAYESDNRNLFPQWVKPSDSEIPPFLVHKFCSGLNNLNNVWDCSNGEMNALLSGNLEDFTNKIDLSLLNRFLKLVVDPTLADYMTSKNNSSVIFKDMSFTNKRGILKGLQFANFIYQVCGLITDLNILGPERAIDLAGDVEDPNNFMQFTNRQIEEQHSLRGYVRYFDRIFVFYRFESFEVDELIDQYLEENPDPNFDNFLDYPSKTCWPRDVRMKLMQRDVELGKAVHWKVSNSLINSMTSLKWEDTFVSIYSKNNANLHFEMCGFEVRMVPTKRLSENINLSESVWDLVNKKQQEKTCKAYLKVSDKNVDIFAKRITFLLMSIGSGAFTKVAAKWNNALVALFTYFREAIISTESLLDILVKSETKIQTRVKLGLNSKMPTRFPPVVFYAPKELGGLGMLSASHILIPASDLTFSKQTDTGITFFRAGMSHEDEKMIPTLFRYITPWENEFQDSERAWQDYAIKRQIALEENRRISFEELEEYWNRGLPRISTLFQKNKHVLAFDKYFRIRSEFKKYNTEFSGQFWWTDNNHDGKLWNLNSYRSDVIQALGGVETILEHSLFRGTGFSSWEGLFWEKNAGFEDSLQMKKLTNAQRTGLSQIPNRRFTLWWSPTINRADVYVGYLVQLDLTGIFLHGKIPTLKISLIQIFRAHLWQKIHESVVFDLCQILDDQIDLLQASEIQKENEFSASDATLYSNQSWRVSKPSPLHTTNDGLATSERKSDKIWIDVQLKYGDYDEHDINRYVKNKFIDYTSDSVSSYPSQTGILVGIDLAYNTYDSFGYWIPGLKPLISTSMATIMKTNPALHVLRERIRKGLQLYQAQTQEPYLNSTNYPELFNDSNKLFIDDTNVYRISVRANKEGHVQTTPINGCVTIMNPKTGDLYLRIIHTSVWKGQSRLAQLAKWKTAEEMTALVRSLPKDEQPSQIIVTRKTIVDPLEVHMLDFPNIGIRPTELRMPFSSILAIDKLAKTVDEAEEPKMVLFNMFDDWLDSISPYTAFSRLILLLRGLKSNEEKGKLILSKDSEVLIKRDHLWPSFSEDQWIDIEAEFRDLILEEFANKYHVNVKALTQTEIKDLILGQNIKAPSVKRQKLVELQEAKNLLQEERKKQIESSETFDKENGEGVVKTKTVNQQGEEIVVVASANYETQSFSSKDEWRSRALANSFLPLRLKNVFVTETEFIETKPVYILPRNILNKFIEISDTKSQIAGLIYGKNDEESNIKEINTLVILPQLGNSRFVSMCKNLPENVPYLDSNGLELLGWIHTYTGEEMKFMPSQDVSIHSKIFASVDMDCIDIIVFSSTGSVSINGFTLTEDGFVWGVNNDNLQQEDPEGFEPEFSEFAQIILSDKITGNFMTPKKSIWNYAFMGSEYDETMNYSLSVDVPVQFYDEIHRSIHFSQFKEIAENEDDVDLEPEQEDVFLM